MDSLTYYVRNDPVISTVMLDHAITVADRHRRIYEAPFSPSKRRKIAPLMSSRNSQIHSARHGRA
jgi:hypothetical protein